MGKANQKIARRIRIKKSIRQTINGTAERPRLSVFRSNKDIYAQLIDDVNNITLASVSSQKLDQGGKTKTEVAAEVGKMLAEKAKSVNVETVVFDRGGYLYHGRVKALADAAREGGLKF